MIRNLNDLVKFTEALEIAKEFPEMRDEVVISRPGCSPETIARIRSQFPGIPENYLDVVRAVRLHGISIGYCQLSCGSATKGFVDKMVEWNENIAYPRPAQREEDGVYLVADWAQNPIGVVYREGPFKVGQVVMYIGGCHPSGEKKLLAHNFEQFLLLIGNLDCLRRKYRDRHDADQAATEAIEEFKAIRDELLSGADGELATNWEPLAEEVLLPV